MDTLNSQRSLNGIREVSVSTAMSQLRLDDGENSQPPSSRSLSHNPFVSNGSHHLENDGPEGVLVLFEPPEGSLVAAQTPSQIPVRSKRYSLNATPSRNPKTSPRKTSRLARDSNNDPFLAWDVRGRLEDMEAMYFEMKDKMAGTNLERSGLEEAVTLYKARGQCLSLDDTERSANHPQSPNSKAFVHNYHHPTQSYRLTWIPCGQSQRCFNRSY
jgi:kinesin family member C1